MLDRFVDFFVRLLFPDSQKKDQSDDNASLESYPIRYTIASVFPPQYSAEDIQRIFRIDPDEDIEAERLSAKTSRDNREKQ